ncbi:MAG: CsbD family protein [Actinomycetota bacterium]
MGLDEKIEAKIDKMKGTAKEKVGESADDPSLEAEGEKDQAKGHAKEAWEEIKEAVKKVRS